MNSPSSNKSPSLRLAQDSPGRVKNHLDIAIENQYLEDIKNIFISPDGDAYHLSLNSKIKGHDDDLWMNIFGTKPFVSDMAVDSIDAVIQSGTPSDKGTLEKWRSSVTDFSYGESDYLVLP